MAAKFETPQGASQGAGAPINPTPLPPPDIVRAELAAAKLRISAAERRVDASVQLLEQAKAQVAASRKELAEAREYLHRLEGIDDGNVDTSGDGANDLAAVPPEEEGGSINEKEVPKAAAAVAAVSKVDSADDVTSLTEDREAEDEAYGETAVLKAAAAAVAAAVVSSKGNSGEHVELTTSLAEEIEGETAESAGAIAIVRTVSTDDEGSAEEVVEDDDTSEENDAEEDAVEELLGKAAALLAVTGTEGESDALPEQEEEDATKGQQSLSSEDEALRDGFWGRPLVRRSLSCVDENASEKEATGEEGESDASEASPEHEEDAPESKRRISWQDVAVYDELFQMNHQKDSQVHPLAEACTDNGEAEDDHQSQGGISISSRSTLTVDRTPARVIDSKEIEVQGCGAPAVNGKYHRFEEWDGVPAYAKIGQWDGQEVMFYMGRWRANSGTRKWYITCTWDGEEGKRPTQLAFYVAYSVRKFSHPPEKGWMVVPQGKEFFLSPSYEGRGLDPAPVVTVEPDLQDPASVNWRKAKLGVRIACAVTASSSHASAGSGRRRRENENRSIGMHGANEEEGGAIDEKETLAAAAAAAISHKSDSADDVTSLTEDREAEDEAYGETAVLKAAAAAVAAAVISSKGNSGEDVELTTSLAEETEGETAEAAGAAGAIAIVRTVSTDDEASAEEVVEDDDTSEEKDAEGDDAVEELLGKAAALLAVSGIEGESDALGASPEQEEEDATMGQQSLSSEEEALGDGFWGRPLVRRSLSCVDENASEKEATGEEGESDASEVSLGYEEDAPETKRRISWKDVAVYDELFQTNHRKDSRVHPLVHRNSSDIDERIVASTDNGEAEDDHQSQGGISISSRSTLTVDRTPARVIKSKEIEVQGCGVPAVNGKYHRFEEWDGVPAYAKIGHWEGKEVMFYIGRWRANNGTRKWYITCTWDGEEGKRPTQLAFYVAYSVRKFSHPPEKGWMVVPQGKEFFLSPSYEGRGVDPPPVVTVEPDLQDPASVNWRKATLGVRIACAVTASSSQASAGSGRRRLGNENRSIGSISTKDRDHHIENPVYLPPSLLEIRR